MSVVVSVSGGCDGITDGKLDECTDRMDRHVTDR